MGNEAQKAVLDANYTMSAAPAFDGVAITPSDSVDLTIPVKALYIGVAGTLKIKTLAGNDLVFSAVSAGVLPWGAKRVYATGTSASGIVGAY